MMLAGGHLRRGSLCGLVAGGKAGIAAFSWFSPAERAFRLRAVWLIADS